MQLPVSDTQTWKKGRNWRAIHDYGLYGDGARQLCHPWGGTMEVGFHF
jgi:hypothetical protein